MKREIQLSKICEVCNLSYIGKDIVIRGLNLCDRQSKYRNIISYATSEKYAEIVEKNKNIGCMVISKESFYAYSKKRIQRELSFVVVEKPEEIFYDIHDYLYYHTDFYEKFDFIPEIGENCFIHPSAVIEAGVIIGKNVTVGANTVIYGGTVIKDNCSIGCNTTIGSEGFQIIRVGGKNRKIVHCGGVLINENVFVGDNTAVCNALFEGETYIGENAMIDNLVHVGHNGYVGDNAVVTAGTVLCGSSVVKDRTWIGVNSSVLNRVTLGSGAKIGIGSVVTRDIPEEALAYGVPAKVKIVFRGGKHQGIIWIWDYAPRFFSIVLACRGPNKAKQLSM